MDREKRLGRDVTIAQQRPKSGQTYVPFPKKPKEAWEVLLDILTASGRRLQRIWIHRVGILAVVLFTSLAYANTLSYPFLFDDIPQITNNEFIQIDRLSADELWEAATKSPLRNRPIPYVTFALNYLWDGYNPVAFHLTNIVIHILTSLIVYWITLLTIDQWKKSVKSPPAWLDGSTDVYVALATSLVFALHPIQIQSVTYIVQRMNSLACLFYLAALAFYIAGRRTPTVARCVVWWSFALVSAGASFLCKQVSITLPVVILLYEWYFFQGLSFAWLRRQALRLAAVALVMGAVGTWYVIGSGGSRLMQTYEKFGFTMTERLLTQPRVLGVYTSLTLLPLPTRFNLLHDVPTSHGFFDPPTTAIAILCLGVYLAVALACARWNSLVSFALLWPLIQLAVESSFIPLEMIYEHRMYLPLFGIALALALLGAWLVPARQQVGRAALLATVALALAVSTHLRNQAWHDPVALWNDVVTKSPMLARPYVNRGNAFLEKGDWVSALNDFERTITIAPDFDMGWFSRGVAYANLGRHEQALDDFTKAIPLVATADLRATVYRNRGFSHMALGRSKEAIADYSEAIKQYPQDAHSYFNRANTYTRLGDHARALDDYRACVNLHPSYAQAHNNLATLLASSSSPAVRNPLLSIEHARRACELTQFKNSTNLDTLAAAYASNSDFVRAAEWQKKALELAPENEKRELARREQVYRSKLQQSSKTLP